MGYLCCSIIFLSSFAEASKIGVWTKESMQELCKVRKDTFKSAINCTYVNSGLIFIPILIDNNRFCVHLDTGSDAFWLADIDTQITKVSLFKETF